MVRGVLFFLICLFFIGCDPLFPPKIRNEFPEKINIHIFYKDGTKSSFFLESCISVFVGPITPIPKHGVKGIFEITVEWKNEVVNEFSEEILKGFLEKQISHGGFSVWVVDPSGVHFSEERACSLEEN